MKRFTSLLAVLAVAVILAGCGGGSPVVTRGRGPGGFVAAADPASARSPGDPASPVAGTPSTLVPGTTPSTPNPVAGATGNAVTASTGHATASKVPPPSTVGAPTTGLPTTSSLPSTTTTVLPAPPPAGTGVFGDVAAGPTCPVERPDQPCPPAPVKGTVAAHDGSGRTAGSTETDSQGRYAITLPPGTYTLVVLTSSPFPRCPSATAVVGTSGPARVDIACDTGIR